MISPLAASNIAVAHGFFTRAGGVSTGPFASLNCSLSGADDRACVLENRARIARHLGAEPSRLLGLTQVHGPVVAVAERAWAPGEGPRADAMVTRVPGLALGIVTADCAPVLFADAAAGVIGAAHAGWRGAVAGVLEATVAAMRALGATRISVAIGPCIRQPSYEVGDDLRDAVLAATPGAAHRFAPGARPGKYQFDLALYCADRLSGNDPAGNDRAGNDITVIDADTLPDAARFFSHRRRTLWRRPDRPPDVSNCAVRTPSCPTSSTSSSCSSCSRWPAVFSRSLLAPMLLPALLGLAACGGLPRPFEGNPGAIGLRLAQPPPARLAVIPPDDASLTPQQSADLAAMLAAALRDQDVPAIFTPPQPGDWRLITTIARSQGQIVPMFTVLDPRGEQSGVAQGQYFTPDSWAGDGAMRQAASNAAPNVASLLTRIEAQRRASDPASLANRPARLRVPDVTGAPGDGNRMLARRMREQLNLLNLNVLPEVPSESPDFTIAGQVLAVPIAGQMVRVEIQWIITDGAGQGEERSRVVQLNEVPAGTLDKYWGDVALVVAQEAASGVKDLITQQTAGTKPAP